MDVPAEETMTPGLTDPVTKAVVDNIMGNLPTKKPLVRCDDCDLSFTSQTVLDAHLQGARHAKQIRSKTIMASLEETKVAFTKDQETNGLKCNVCNVCLNSIQQLQTHLNGSRHRKKASKGGWASASASTSTTAPATTTTTSTPGATNNALSVNTANLTSQQTASSAAAAAAATTNNVAATTGGIQISGPMKSVARTCDLCNKFFNSEAQYSLHVQTKKHIEKANKAAGGNKTTGKKKRFFPYWRKPKAPVGNPVNNLRSIHSNFISGGFVHPA